MSNVNLILCQNHQKRKAYRYCEQCKEFICNSCALQEKHINHIQQIKSFSDTIKSYLPYINSLNKTSLSKYIELFHFIVNYNSSFMPMDITNIINQINDKFDNYINKLVDLKIKLKILISEKFELLNSIFNENENKIIETQNKLLSILNNEDEQYFEKMNTCLEQLRLNRNDKKSMDFVDKYNTLIKQAFDDENDFNIKYNLYSAQKQIEKNNKLIKENILDKLIQPCFNDAIKNIDNIYQKINAQSNSDLDSLKKKFDYLKKNPNKDDIEDEENENININEIINEKITKKEIKTENKPDLKDFRQEIKLRAVKTKQEPPKKIIKEEPKPKIIKEEPKKIIKEEPKPKLELLKIEFEPPDIESCQFTQKELEEMDNENDDDEYENEFLRIEEDGDDGMLLAEIVDGNDSEDGTVDLEEFFINNMDDKLDIQYYEGIKFEGESGGEGLNEALVGELDEEIKDEEKKVEENQKEEEIKEEPKVEEVKIEEQPKVEEPIKEQPKKVVGTPKKEVKAEQPKKVNAIEEIKMRMFAKQGGNPQQMLKPIPSSGMELPPGKVPGKLNPDFMNKMQNRYSGNEPKNPQPFNKKKEIKESPSFPKKREEKKLNINDNNNIAQFIEDKNEQQEEEPKTEQNEEIKEEEIKENKEKIITNTAGKDQLEILKNLVKNGGRTRIQFQTLLREIPFEERGKVELMSIDQKNSSIHIYNELSNKIDEIKTTLKFPMHLSYINLPPYLYISGGKVNGKDSTSVQKIQRIDQNEFSMEEIAQLKQGRSNHCTIFIQSINSLIFISGSRIKSCEKYSFTKEKIESFPGLKVSREKCCACLINEKYLYVFFGFDRTKNKFETTIERIFINDAMSWETITITANQNILKKQNFACIPFEKDKQKGVIIVGGINSLRNETKETVFINLDSNKGEVFNQLPFNSSFTNSYFISFGKYSCYNELINISNEFNVVKFNLDNNNFFGL